MPHTPDTLGERQDVFRDNAIELLNNKLLLDIEECYGLSRAEGVGLISQVIDGFWQGVKYDRCAPISQAEFHLRDADVNLAKAEACIKCTKREIKGMQGKE